MQQDDPITIGKTLAEMDNSELYTPLSDPDSYDPRTDDDPRVRAAKQRQIEFDAWRKANPHVTTVPAADALAVLIARLEVMGEQAGPH